MPRIPLYPFVVRVLIVPSKKRYPLDPLLHQREERVDERARELQERARERQRAERARAAAEREREEHAERTARLTQSEAERFEAGEADAGDLLQLHAWRIAQREQAQALEQREQAARKYQLQATDQVSQARQGLAEARAEAKVVEEHRRRFRQRERKDEERRLEQEVEDVVHAQHCRRKT